MNKFKQQKQSNQKKSNIKPGGDANVDENSQ